MNQITLLLLGLLCQNVAVVSVMSLNLTCSGERESLLRAGVCLNFWHFFNFLIFKLFIYKSGGNAYTGRYAPVVISNPLFPEVYAALPR